MIRRVKTAVLAALLTLGVAATADRTEAQVYYSYPPAGTYYGPVTQPASNLTYYAPQSSYYTPQLGYGGTAYSSFYTPTATPNAAASAPVRAWDGGWSIGGYTSPALEYYNSYRATGPGPRR
jgi:hypothetical protein